ncbi:hypothetical protein AMTR_s00043p00181980 [Amborella trichopoda]|uniref:Uncharacterized protein n=1 Tax=Amborella trichopoda TaxID=13333 RepID=W1PYZ8_AMBTC|nr:hypothetical protein AMTR_s00043p00181980 [Amborella trichopoda]
MNLTAVHDHQPTATHDNSCTPFTQSLYHCCPSLNHTHRALCVTAAPSLPVTNSAAPGCHYFLPTQLQPIFTFSNPPPRPCCPTPGSHLRLSLFSTHSAAVIPIFDHLHSSHHAAHLFSCNSHRQATNHHLFPPRRQQPSSSTLLPLISATNFYHLGHFLLQPSSLLPGSHPHVS